MTGSTGRVGERFVDVRCADHHVYHKGCRGCENAAELQDALNDKEATA